MALTREQFLFTKLAEEAAEIAHIALKTQQFGRHERHPELDEDNEQRVCAELLDLAAIVRMLQREFGFMYDENSDESINHIYAKEQKVNKYWQYSLRLGQVEA